MNILFLPELNPKEKDETYWKTLYLLCYQVIHKGIDTVITDMEKVQQECFPDMTSDIIENTKEEEIQKVN